MPTLTEGTPEFEKQMIPVAKTLIVTKKSSLTVEVMTTALNFARKYPTYTNDQIMVLSEGEWDI